MMKNVCETRSLPPVKRGKMHSADSTSPNPTYVPLIDSSEGTRARRMRKGASAIPQGHSICFLVSNRPCNIVRIRPEGAPTDRPTADSGIARVHTHACTTPDRVIPGSPNVPWHATMTQATACMIIACRIGRFSARRRRFVVWSVGDVHC